MSIFDWGKPRVDIHVKRSPKTDKWYWVAVATEVPHAILGVGAARHTTDSKQDAVAEAHQVARVRKIIVEE